MKDKKVSVLKLVSTNPIKTANVDTPIKLTTFGLKMGGAWGSSGLKAWFDVQYDGHIGRTTYLSRVPLYYTKSINWNGATMNGVTWSGENGSTGYNSGVQIKFK